MRVISARPTGPLSTYVYWFAYYDGFAAEDRGFRMIPEGTVDILFPLEGRTTITTGASNAPGVTVWEPALVGPQQSYSIYDTSECTRAFGIVFTPGGAARFLGPQIGELTNSIIPARDVLGPAFRVLHERLPEDQDPSRIFNVAEAFLRKRFDPELRYAEEIDFAIAAIRRGETANISLADFAENTIGFSPKHFVELFKRRAGLAPKRYQQIVRFNRMLERCRLYPPVTWSRLAPAFGYVDHSHLAKDFHRLAGITPGEYLRAAWTHRQVFSETAG
ncbi:MAG: DUF6597 domain-containing transcriptional factor [Spirochaetota bacterium]